MNIIDIVFNRWTWIILLAISLSVMGNLWWERGKHIDKLEGDLNAANKALDLTRQALKRTADRNHTLDMSLKELMNGAKDPESIEWGNTRIPDGELERMREFYRKSTGALPE